MIDVGASLLSACICDLPCKNDLLYGIAQKYNRRNIVQTWTHKETIIAKALLASLKPPCIISTHLHHVEDPLY
jgi:hypothetical protein